VIFSFDFFLEAEILRMVASSHIGIALYETKIANDRLVAFSSSKMANYALCGIPVIAFDTDSFMQLMKTHRCGGLIRSVDEIPESVHRIRSIDEKYERDAHVAFEQFYDLERNFAKFRTQFDVTLQDTH
jgi:hypothetical protein